LVGGRSRDRVLRAAADIGLSDEHTVAVNAADANLAHRLRESAVNTVIHTAGPFQGQRYDVAQAAIDAGCHYIDLADGRMFVSGIRSLDARARDHRISVISGASSVPALSSAVIDRYLPTFEHLETVRVGISSGGRVPGLATVRGVFSCAGRPIRRL